MCEEKRAPREWLARVARARARKNARRARLRARRSPHAPPTRLEQACELGVAVRDVLRLAVDERRDDVAERREAQVDLGRLLEPVAGRARLGLALRAGEVDEVELADADVLAAVVRLAALDDDGEDGVRARARLVHERRADRAVLLARLHHLVDLVRRLDDEAREVLHVHARVDVLLQVEPVLRVLREQVADLLVVDLEVRRAHEVLLRRLGDRDLVEDLLERVGDDAAQLGRVGVALHRVRLARARLPVRKDGRVEAVEHGLDRRRGRLVVEPLLRDVGAEDVVERERLGRLALVALRVLDDDRAARGVGLGVRLVAVLLLLARERADAHDDLDALALVRHVRTRGSMKGLPERAARLWRRREGGAYGEVHSA